MDVARRRPNWATASVRDNVFPVGKGMGELFVFTVNS
jgi:hypothetical protein